MCVKSEYETLKAIMEELKMFAETHNAPVIINTKSEKVTRPDESSILPVPSIGLPTSCHLEYFDGSCYYVTVLKDRTEGCE
jgi:hypothetical protein